jgi:hypothetical protein
MGQMPVEGPNGNTCVSCPTGYTLQIDAEGYHCAATTTGTGGSSGAGGKGGQIGGIG